MARGENPGALLSIETTLTYDKDVKFGHASAGKDLALMVIATGANAGKAQLATDDSRIIGKFMDLDKDGVASYMPSAQPMILRKTSATIVPGHLIIGGGAGKVKTAPEPTTETAASATLIAKGRGTAIKVLETADNGRILVNI